MSENNTENNQNNKKSLGIINKKYVINKLRNGVISLDKYRQVVQEDLDCIKAALEGRTSNYDLIPEDIKTKKWVANAYYTAYIKEREKEIAEEDQETLEYKEYESYYPEYLIEEQINSEINSDWEEYSKKKREQIQNECNIAWKEHNDSQLEEVIYEEMLSKLEKCNEYETYYPYYILVQNAVYYANLYEEDARDAIADVLSDLDDVEFIDFKNSLKNKHKSIAIEFINPFMDVSLAKAVDDEIKSKRIENKYVLHRAQ